MLGGREDCESVTDRDLDDRLREIELADRCRSAERARIIGEVERRASFATDGHRSIAGYLRAHTNCSSGSATKTQQLARFVAAVPQAGDALAGGSIGIGQAHLLAAAFANPRCGDQLVGFIDIFLGHAEDLSYKEFRVCVERWEKLADIDGAHRDRARAVEGRNARVRETGNGAHVTVDGGTPLQAAEMKTVFDAFVELEFAADVAERTRLHGADAPTSLLPRTHAQRCFDAMEAIFRAAGSVGKAGGPLDIVVNVTVDQHTFESSLADRGLAPQPDDLVTPTPSEQRCETEDGTPLLACDVADAAIDGRVRRVVMNSAGTVINMGRRQRLFTGSARVAAKLSARGCGHPGCELPAKFCDVDHMKPWAAENGPTDQVNGGLLCDPHDRLKHRQHRKMRRSRDGMIYAFDADDRPIVPVGQDPPVESDFLTDEQLATRIRARVAAL